MKNNSDFIKISVYISIFFIILILIMTIFFKIFSTKIYTKVVLEKESIYKLKYNIKDVSHNLILYNENLDTKKLEYSKLLWTKIYKDIDNLKCNKDEKNLSELKLKLIDLKELHWWIAEFAKMDGNNQAKYFYQKNIKKILDNIYKIVTYASTLNIKDKDSLKLKDLVILIHNVELDIVNFIYEKDKKNIVAFYTTIEKIQKLINNLKSKNIFLLEELKREIKAFIYYFGELLKIDSNKNSYSKNLIQIELIPLESEILNLLNKITNIKDEILKESIEFKDIFGNILIISFSLLIIFILSLLKYVSKQQYKVERYMDIVDKSVITSTTDKNGIITDASEAFSKISGYSKKELIGSNHNIIRHPDTKDELYKELWSSISSGKSWNGEIKNLAKDKSAYWVRVSITPLFDKNKNIIGYTSIRENITDKKIIEDISITDELTKLYNRRYFNEIFKKEIARNKRDKKYLSFLILDIDHFKQYNDTYGHQAGDNVLSAIGKTLKSELQRSSDFAFRLGGEEFGIIFSGLSENDSLTFANKIRNSIKNLKIKHAKNSASNFVTASFGLIVRNGDKITNEDELYKLADDALYEAKDRGRDRVILSKKEM